MSRTEPLPCPFCGAEMTLTEQGNLGHPQDECLIVALLYACNGYVLPEEPKLIDLWNRRANP